MFSFRTTALEDQLDRSLFDGPVACFCTRNSWNSGQGGYVEDIFRSRGNLQRIFQPAEAEFAPASGQIDFAAQELEDLRAVIVEIQDTGSRDFPYTRDVMRLLSFRSRMEEGPAIYIVDHFNPAGRVVEGSIPAGECGPWTPKVAHRHGLTLGELAHLYCQEIGAKFPLHIISAQLSDAGRDLMPWAIPPAPDIPGLFTCDFYSGMSLWTETTLTPGIGTPRPYEYIGAPFLKAEGMPPVPPGVRMRPCRFMPSSGMYAGEVCTGYQLLLLPGTQYHALQHTLQLMRWFSEHNSRFEMRETLFQRLSDPVMEAYLRGQITFDIVEEHIKGEEQKWIRKAKRYLLYDDTPFRIK